MRLSIVIPTHNYAQYLDRCLQSVLPQTTTDTKVIVVDDGSTDSTAEIMRGYVSGYPQVSYLYQKQGGPGMARNVGARAAQGDWIMFLDADDYLHQNALAVFTQAIKDNPAAATIVGGFVNQDKRGRLTPIKGPKMGSRIENFAAFLSGDLRINPGGFVMRLDVFHAIGEYPENIFLSEDKVLWGRLFANYSVVGVPEPIVFMCAHPERLRDNHAKRHHEALSYVDQLFYPEFMPPAFQQFKNRAYAKAQLDLEQSLYRQRHYAQAIGYFHNALGQSWRLALQFKYLRYYLVSLAALTLQSVVNRMQQKAK